MFGEDAVIAARHDEAKSQLRKHKTAKGKFLTNINNNTL